MPPIRCDRADLGPSGSVKCWIFFALLALHSTHTTTQTNYTFTTLNIHFWTLLLTLVSLLCEPVDRVEYHLDGAPMVSLEHAHARVDGLLDLIRHPLLVLLVGLAHVLLEGGALEALEGTLLLARGHHLEGAESSTATGRIDRSEGREKGRAKGRVEVRVEVRVHELAKREVAGDCGRLHLEARPHPRDHLLPLLGRLGRGEGMGGSMVDEPCGEEEEVGWEKVRDGVRWCEMV